MTKQAQLTKMIHVYTDLLNSISGLFTAMIDSHLNHLMKYLNSVALIIAIPTLISGIWGMNIGGLPDRTNKNGFWIIINCGYFDNYLGNYSKEKEVQRLVLLLKIILH